MQVSKYQKTKKSSNFDCFSVGASNHVLRRKSLCSPLFKMLLQFVPTFFKDMSECHQIPKTTPWPICELSYLVCVHTLILMKGCAGISISNLEERVCCWNNMIMINIFLLHSYETRNCSPLCWSWCHWWQCKASKWGNPQFFFCSGDLNPKYGDAIYGFGDADLGPCKVTNDVDLFKESTGMAPFHQWRLSTQLWYAKQFALGQVECSSRYLDQDKSNKIYQCGMTFAHTQNAWGSFCLARISALEVPSKTPRLYWGYDVWSAYYTYHHVFWDKDQVGLSKKAAIRPSIWI